MKIVTLPVVLLALAIQAVHIEAVLADDPQGREVAEQWTRDVAIARGLPYVIEPPDVVRIAVQSNGKVAKLDRKSLVGPDGKIDLGKYGQVYIAGLTIEQSQKVIEKHLSEELDAPRVKVEIAKFNSKRMYVIVKGEGRGDSIAPVLWTNESNVLHALFAAETDIGLEDRVTIHRAGSFNGKAARREVDLKAVVRGDLATNYDLLPGDRIIVTLATPAVEKDEAPVSPTPAAEAYGPSR